MDWDNARVFLAAARAGQFLAAAKTLGVDHATVARRITKLEEKLGAKLFERRTTGCALTTAGETFLSAAERIETEVLRIQSELSGADDAIAGTVRIGAPDGFGTLFLAGRLGAFAERHAGLTLQLAPMPRVFSLSRREADIAITIDRPEEGRLAVRKLTDYSLHFYAAKSYLASHGAPAAAEDLKRHRLVTYVPDILFSPALNFMPELFSPEFRRLECAGALGQNEAVRAGAGIGILHDYHAMVDPLLAMVLPDLVFRRSYWIVTHLDNRAAPRIRTTADFIAGEVERSRGMFLRD
jgi:DNA-binding transcriptional LysR family regulator